MKWYDWQNKIIEHEGNITIRGGRQTGKSKSVAERIYHLALKYPGSRHLIIAASERQENYIYEEVRKKIKNNYKGRSTLHLTTMKNDTQIFKFPVGITGIYLEGLASVDFLHADEAIHIWPKVWDSILPMLAEPRKRGLGWITLLSSTRGKPKGFFKESFDRKDFMQVQIKAEDCEHISKEFLAEEKIRLGERMYNVIYNGEFDEQAMQYFPTEIIERQIKFQFFRKEEIDRNKKYYLGVDPARYGKSKAAFAVAEEGYKEKLRIVHGEEMQKSSLTELKIKIRDLDSMFLNLIRSYFIDDGGFGAGLIDYLMEDKLIKRKIKPMNNSSSGKEGKILKEDLYSNVFSLLSSGKLELLNNPIIIEGLKKVEFDAENKIFGTDMSEAICRACWGIKDKRYKLRMV